MPSLGLPFDFRRRELLSMNLEHLGREEMPRTLPSHKGEEGFKDAMVRRDSPGQRNRRLFEEQKTNEQDNGCGKCPEEKAKGRNTIREKLS